MEKIGKRYLMPRLLQKAIDKNNNVEFNEDLIDLFMKDWVIGVGVVCLQTFRRWDYILVS